MMQHEGFPVPVTSGFLSPERLLSAVVNSSDDAIISKDLNGVVTSWNPAAERIFGWTAEEAVGRPVAELVIPEDRLEEEPQILERLRRGERVDHFETVRKRKDGGLLNVSLTISPVRDDRGVIRGASKIARDITERRRSEEALRRVAEEAERQSRMKDEFLATLSHELRTPLQSILGWVQVLRAEDCEPPEIAEALEIIDRNARAQTRIIEDLLDMNRILSGKVRLDVRPLSLAAVLEEALETVKPAAKAKGIRLLTLIDPRVTPVAGDPERLRQVFWNLFSNAIKFTPAGGRVRVVLERVNSRLEVSVSDNGEGIDPEFLPHVFERFRQGDASTTRRHGGLGLGLAIVKNLVELHGGSVRAESAGFSKGSTFTVTLPPAPAHPEKPGQEGPRDLSREPDELPRAAVQAPEIKGIRVLVVDDETDARALLARLLTRAGALVETADSAARGLERLESGPPPDVIISDIGMPGTDGLSFIRVVRALPPERGGNIPAIALSAYTRAEDRVGAIRAGFQTHVAKPADTLELLTAVAGLTGNTRPRAETL